MIVDSIINLDYTLIHILNGSGSMFLDSVMITLTSGLTWIPLYLGLLFLVIKNNETLSQVILTIVSLLLAVAVSYYLSDLTVKPLVARLRPCNNPELAGLVSTINGYSASDYSFYSAHASNTMTIAIFASLLIRNRLFSVFLLLWSLVNCYTRLYLAMHYPSDIIVGLFVGLIIGSTAYLVYRFIFRKISHNPKFISSHFTKTGYALGDVYVAELFVVIALVYAVIKSTIYVGLH